jgi:hypothetical protein
MSGNKLEVETFSSFKTLLKKRGYSEETIREIYKWYDFSKKKGAASF